MIGVGQIVGAKYELVRILGHGSMGQVWVAHHSTLGEDVALKLLAPAPGGEHASTSAARFRFEAQIAARLSRETRHIVRVTDHGEEDNGLAYLVMELLEGETLDRLLLRGPMDPSGVARVVAQIARALEEAHAESIVHRDLKPANVFVTRDEDGGLLVKLLDFGIARAIRTQRVAPTFATGDGLIFGTPGYMSPEQACASKVDPRCDLWALATVAYEALTGDIPLTGTSTGQLLKNLHAGQFVPVHARRPDLPIGLGAFFERAFARRIENRFVSASQLAVAFEQAVGADWRSPARPLLARLAVRDGRTLPAPGALKSRRRLSAAWARARSTGPMALLSLAIAMAPGTTPAQSTPAADLAVQSATAQRAEQGATTAPPAPFEGLASADLPDRAEIALDRREPAMAQKSTFPASVAPRGAPTQTPKPASSPRLLPTSPALPSAKPVDRSAVL